MSSPALSEPTGISRGLARIRNWGEERAWSGYDPYDGLNSPLARALPFPIAKRALTQAVKLSPFNLRPLLGIEPSLSPKAVALVASGYTRLAVAGDSSAREQAEQWLDWLVAQGRGAWPGLAWGYHFPVQTRIFGYERGTPNAIATSFAAQALLEGAELLGEERWLVAGREAARFFDSELSARAGEQVWFRYLPGEDELVHNANALVCAVLARGARLAGEPLPERVASALEPTLAAQRPDGSWPYAEAPGHDWVDNFHTGYVLESLAECARLDGELEDPLRRGLEFWESELFLPDGTPKYTPTDLYPIDAHCYAQAVETWLAVGRPDRASRAGALLVERMLDPAGFVHFQQRRLWTSRVPLIRWTTAPSFRALAGVLLAEETGARLG